MVQHPRLLLELVLPIVDTALPVVIVVIIKQVFRVIFPRELVLFILNQVKVASILKSQAAIVWLVYDFLGDADAVVPEQTEASPTNDVSHLYSFPESPFRETSSKVSELTAAEFSHHPPYSDPRK
jgi:hypothetical protein